MEKLIFGRVVCMYLPTWMVGRKDNDQAGDDSLRALALCITNIRQKTPILLTHSGPILLQSGVVGFK